jgi:ABC-type nitrate/sulfonate/bicarbonate transport system substrate-binding protein
MATLAGYPDFGNTFDVRDLQGGLVARLQYLHERREQARAMIRATLRSMDSVVKNEAEAVAYLHRDFALEPKIATDTYRILKQIVNTDGDIEEPVLKTILEKLKQEAGVSAEIPLDRLVDLSLLREVKTELSRKP